MTNATNLDIDAVAQAGLADPEYKGIYHNKGKGSMDVTGDEKNPSIVEPSVVGSDDEWPDKPTDEELSTLRRVSGPIMWSMWTIAFVELCERFSYYGSSVLYTNYVNNGLPLGSTNGSPVGSRDPNAGPGALGFGPKAAQGISLTNQFFTYLTPLLG
jgi:POT family proton-dependent oligopeptide transporter